MKDDGASEEDEESEVGMEDSMNRVAFVRGGGDGG